MGMAKFNTYKSLLSDMLSFAKSMGIKTDAQEDKLAAINFAMDTSCASEAPAAPAKKDDKKPVTPAKKDDKRADKSGTSTGFLPALPVAKKDDKKDAKPAAKKDDKKAAPAKKNRILQAPVKKEEKKPVTPAKKDDKKHDKKDDKKDEKKDDKKPVTPAKKDDKKPVTPAKKADSSAWSMDTKIGEVTAWTNWNAYVTMPQVALDTKAVNFGKECNNSDWRAFFGPVVFGKIDAKPRDFKDFKAMFEILKFLNANLSNAVATKAYEGMMGKTWFAKLKVHIKTTGLKIKGSLNKVGKAIKA